MPPSENLRALISEQASGSCDFPDDARDRLLGQLKKRYGEGLVAVLIYGSYLRGKRDTLLDFYVLLDSYQAMPKRWHGWLAKLLPPNVYQIFDGTPPDETRAKYALMTLKRFERCVRRDFHSYFWARFAQPCGLLYCRDEAARRRVIAAAVTASSTFVRHVVPRLPDEFAAEQLWATGLSLTYRCEFRSEPPDHAARLFGFWPEYYGAATHHLAQMDLGFVPGARRRYRNVSTQSERRRSAVAWGLRAVYGKILSTARLLKAALTFDGALEYLLWKIHRHSGIYLEPSPMQVRFPLFCAWPLLWRLWRRGAFR
jgi:hypothetical protein